MIASEPIWLGTDNPPGESSAAIYRLDWTEAAGGAAASGPAAAPRVVAQAASPTFLALNPTADRLYAAHESLASVSSYEIIGGELRLSGEVTSGGAGACHVLAHPEGRWLYVSNYIAGSFAAIELTDAGDVSANVIVCANTGSGPNRERQQGPHMHSATLSVDGAFVIVADLGTDELLAYPLQDGRPINAPVRTALPPGTGPRHLVVAGGFLYVAGELSGELLVLEWDRASGRGTVIQRIAASTLPGVHQLSHIARAGAMILVAVRGVDSLSAFVLSDGGARLVRCGETPTLATPRHFAVVGSDVLVAGQDANAIAVHALDAPTGPAGDGGAAGPSGVSPIGPVRAQFAVPVPMCVLPR